MYFIFHMNNIVDLQRLCNVARDLRYVDIAKATKSTEINSHT